MDDKPKTDLTELNRKVIRGESKGRIIWQPRIGCWYSDRIFNNIQLPEPYTGMDLPAIYRELGCSNRNYSFNSCFIKKNDPKVKYIRRKLSEMETEEIYETPVGSIDQIMRANTSNRGRFPKKWWVEKESDLKVVMWMEERCSWEWDQEAYDREMRIWGDTGLPAMYMPRINLQNLYVDLMGVENGIFAIYDFREITEQYFKILSESHERLMKVVNESPIEFVNYGDNVHQAMLPPELFERYAMPEYQKRNEILHKRNKFTSAHWDGDTKLLLKYANKCGFDGIEAVTPEPQGDVTLQEVKEAFGDELFLIDGIAALLFEERYPLDQLETQVREAIDLFAPKLILGISDEISSNGNLDRIKFVGDIVDKYNQTIKG